MKRSVAVLAFLLLVQAALGETIVYDSFQSPSLNGYTIYVTVYLPTGYDPSGDPYRLYVFLHGCCGYGINLCQQTMQPVLNVMIDGGQIDPMIVVWPRVEGCDFMNSHQWTDSERNGRISTAITADLLDFLEGRYNVAQSRFQRAVGGFSMGGDGATRMAIRNSDKFLAFVSQSGSPALDAYRSEFTYVIQECPETQPPYTYHPSNGFWTTVMFGNASAFSPNLTNPPWLLDLPLLPSGEVDESVFTGRWIANHDPATMIQNPQVYTHDIAMYFEVGSGDTHTVLFNTLFDEQLNALGIPHTFETFAGGHEHQQARVAVTLDWLDDVFDQGATAVPEQHAFAQPALLALYPGQPSPAAGTTRMVFEMNEPSQIALEAFDVSGRKVATLAEGFRGAGTHEILWNTMGIPAGVYLCQLRGDHGVVSRRLVVTR